MWKNYGKYVVENGKNQPQHKTPLLIKKQSQTEEKSGKLEIKMREK